VVRLSTTATASKGTASTSGATAKEKISTGDGLTQSSHFFHCAHSLLVDECSQELAEGCVLPTGCKGVELLTLESAALTDTLGKVSVGQWETIRQLTQKQISAYLSNQGQSIGRG
jgi:hypothetical protein